MRLFFAPLAEQDLESIADYIAADKPRRAVSFIQEFRQQCQRIAMMKRLDPAPSSTRPAADRLALRQALLAGAAAPPASPAGTAYFASLRQQVKTGAPARKD